MSAAMLVGTLLVLSTWLLLGALIVSTGLAASLVIAPRTGVVSLLRSGLWWGLAIATLLVLLVGLFAPLGSVAAGLAIVGALLILAVLGVALLIRRRPTKVFVQRPGGAVWLVLVSLALMTSYLAYKTLGPATNYDTGLYHWGFIQYFSDFGNVPGLVNLFLPFGYANAQFPLAAALTSGPWQFEGWRLLNGLVVTFVVLELFWRLLERRWTWGTFTLLVGIAGVALPLVAMADSLVASPTSDTSVLLLTLVLTVYLVDAIDSRSLRSQQGPERFVLNLGVVAVVTGLTVAMRPTMLAYGAGVALVVAVVLWRRRMTFGVAGRTTVLVGVSLPGLWLLAVGGLQVYRDYLLSGWLLYPLSIFSWDVPWLGRDPVNLRDATLAAARDPYAADGYQVAHSWEWLGAWIARLPTQWEPWFLLASVIVLVTAGLWARHVDRFQSPPRALLLSLVPGTLATVVWFVASPPSFRFIWGPLFSMFFVVIGAAVLAVYRTGRSVTVVVAGAAIVVLAVTSFSVLFRNLNSEYTGEAQWSLGPLNVTYDLAPVPEAPTRPITMVTGLVIQEPEYGDQCWASYPLCTFSMGDRIGLMGDTISDGFFTAP